MPSIPQSLLWISLVVLWLFVLVPMLISKRETVRRTSDVTLSTRVLNSGKSRLLKRRGPSAGHHHDPDWAPAGGGFENLESDDVESDHVGAPGAANSRSDVLVKSARSARESTGESEPDYLDVDVVDEDSGALPIGGVRREDVRPAPGQPSLFDDTFDLTDEPEEPVAERHAGAAFEAESDGSVDLGDADLGDADLGDADLGDAELDDDLGDADMPEAESEASLDASIDYDDNDFGRVGNAARVDDAVGESGRAATRTATAGATPRVSRTRRTESATAAAVSARKYRFRKRVLMTMAVIVLFTAALSFSVNSGLWWLCGTAVGVTVLYLAYLRRQTRIEAQVRRRRQQRMARSRLGVENTQDREFDVVPSRLRRPGAAVLEIDDEDPVFEHLDEVAFARQYDLPRAAGQ